MERMKHKIKNLDTIKLKVSTIIVLLVTMLTFVAVVPIYAVNSEFVLSAAKTTVRRGESVVLKVRSKNTGDISGGFNAYNGTLNYDTSVLTIENPQPSLAGWTPVYNPEHKKFIASDPTTLDLQTKDVEVFTIKVDVLPNAPLGESIFSLSDLAVSDKNYRNVRLPNTQITLIIADKDVVPDKSNNNSLKDLVAKDEKGATITLSPKFSSANKNYTAAVGKDQNQIDISGLVSDSKATIISGNGKHDLKPGKNIIDVLIRAENGVETTYTITVDKPLVDSGDNNDGNSNNDDGGTNNNGDNNSGNGGNNSNTGSDVSGNPSTGSNQDININNSITNNNTNTNNNSNDNKNSSSNNYLTGLNGFGNLDKPFNKNETIYHSVVGRETRSLDLSVTLEDSKASYEIFGDKDLQIGLNDVIVKVTAANGEIREYCIIVERTHEESSSLLSNMSVGGYAINPGFREDQMFYSLVVPSDVTTLGVSASAKHGGALVNVAGNENIQPGLNYLKVSVTANGVMNTYVVEVVREQPAPTIDWLPWIIAGIGGFISLLLLILLAIKTFSKPTNNSNPRPYYEPAPYYPPTNYYQNSHPQVMPQKTPQEDDDEVYDILRNSGVNEVTREIRYSKDVQHEGQMITQDYKVIKTFRRSHNE